MKIWATYNSRTNSLVNALEGQNSVAQILVLSILVKERPSDCQELLTGIFTKDVIQEIYSCQILIKFQERGKHLLKASNTDSCMEV